MIGSQVELNKMWRSVLSSELSHYLNYLKSEVPLVKCITKGSTIAVQCTAQYIAMYSVVLGTVQYSALHNSMHSALHNSMHNAMHNSMSAAFIRSQISN